MEEIINRDLAGWKIEIWYELRLSNDETGANYDVAGYFKDKDLASASGKGKAWYGADGNVVEVFVLTKDGLTGYVVGDEQVLLGDEESIRALAVAKAREKLTPEERKLLNIE